MKIKFSKKAKKISIISFSTLLLATPIITASSISYTQSVNSSSSVLKNDNYNYVMKNIDKVVTKSETTNSKWSIREENSSEIKYFDSPYEMQKYITNQYVKKVNVKSAYDLSKYVDPLTGILGNDKNGDDIWKNISFDQNPEIKTVYRGNDGQIFETEAEAKKSFEQIYEAYYFNDIYFNTKEELKKYLYDEYFINNPVKYNAITIKAPNGMTSYSIKVTDPNFNSLVDNFVANNVSTVIKYDRTIDVGGSTQFDKSFYFTKENYKNNLSEINPKDLIGQRMYSNQGKSQYILDTSFDDSHNLYAPYFYEGTLDIGSFSNKSNWSKTESDDLGQYKSGIVNDSIASVFNLLLNENNQQLYNIYTNNPDRTKLFEIPDLGSLNEDAFLLNENYLPTIKKFNKSLYDEIYTMYINLLHGKRYNSFYKIPILYTFIMQKIISYNLPQLLLDLTVNYFSKVCDHVQKLINSVILRKDFLVNVNNEKNVFDLKGFFNIGNSQYNLNTSIESYMESLKSNFPLLSISLFMISIASNDLNSYAGLISSYDFFVKYLKDFGLLNDRNSNLFDYHRGIFEKIYNIFITKDIKKASDIVSINNNFDINSFNLKYFEFVFSNATKFYFGAQGYCESDLNKYYNPDFSSTSKLTGNFMDMVGYNPKQHENDRGSYFIYDENGIARYVSPHDPFVVYDEYFKSNGNLIRQIASHSEYTIYDIYFLLINDYNDNYNLTKKDLSVDSATDYNKAILKLNAYKEKLNNKFTLDYNTQSTTVNSNLSMFFKVVASKPDSFNDYSQKELSKNASESTKQIIAFSFEIAKITAAVLSKSVPVLGPIIQVIESTFKLIDILFVPKTEQYHYSYRTLNNDVFIWDGGSETRMFFNIAKIKETTSDNMDLLAPIEFVLPQTEEFFYYEQKRYFNLNNLANIQMQTMFNNISKNDYNPPSKAFSYQYTFDLIPYNNNVSENPLTSDGEIRSFDTVDEVKNYVRQDIIDYLNGTNIASKYLNANVFAFNNGLNSQSDEAIKINLINNILENIRPTYMALKPNLDTNGFALNNKKSFILPNKSWTSINGLYQNKELDISNYIIDNSANELKNGQVMPDNDFISKKNYAIFSPIQAADHSKQQVVKMLDNEINIQQKSVLRTEFVDVSDFNNLNNEVYGQTLYQVKLPNQTIEYFTDVVDAQKWLSKNLNTQKITNYSFDEKYIFNGLTFNSMGQLKEWIINNEKLINQMRGL